MRKTTMSRSAAVILALTLISILPASSISRAEAPSVDLSSYRADCGIDVHRDGDRLVVAWPMEGERGQITLDLVAGRPLFASIGVSAIAGRFRPILESADPTCFLVVGSRQAPVGRPPAMSVFNVF